MRGVGFWWDKDTLTRLTDGGLQYKLFDPPFAEDIHRIGIPYSCTSENTEVYLVNKDIALQIPDGELKHCLSKGVLMDAEALNIVNERGFGEYTGFKTVGSYTENTLERTVPHRLNMVGEYSRNIRQAFAWGGKEAYVIDRTALKAEYLAEHYDLYGALRGSSAGIFENSLGGRVCVEGITPFDWYDSLPRSVHAKNVLRWLSRDTLPAYVASFHRISVWCRGSAVFLANSFTEDAENVVLKVKTESRKGRLTVTKGSKIISEGIIASENLQAGYQHFVIPCLPMIGTALLEF